MTIGERINSLRHRSRTLEFDLGLIADEIDDQGMDLWTFGLRAALKLSRAYTRLIDPSPAVAALVVELSPHDNEDDLDEVQRAKEMLRELKTIEQIFLASGLKDESFRADLKRSLGFEMEMRRK